MSASQGRAYPLDFPADQAALPEKDYGELQNPNDYSPIRIPATEPVLYEIHLSLDELDKWVAEEEADRAARRGWKRPRVIEDQIDAHLRKLLVEGEPAA